VTGELLKVILTSGPWLPILYSYLDGLTPRVEFPLGVLLPL